MRKPYEVPNTDLATLREDQQLVPGPLLIVLGRLNRERWPGAGAFGTKCSVLATDLRRALRELDAARADTVERHTARDAAGNPEPVFHDVPDPEGGQGATKQVPAPGMIRIEDPAAYAADLATLLAGVSEVRAIPFTLAELDQVDCESELKEALLPFVDFGDDPAAVSVPAVA